MKISDKIINLFKTAKIESVDDSGGIRTALITFLAKAKQKITLFTPYGLMSNPPVNSLAIVWTAQGQESKQIGFADDPKNRPIKNLNPGEVVIGNYDSGSYIFFSKDGTIVIKGNIRMDGGVIKGDKVFNTANSDKHIHSQGPDSDLNTEQDVGYPKKEMP